MKHGALLRKGTSKNIKVFILLRFTEFEKMLPFYKNISFFRLQIATTRRIDWKVSTFENVKLLCLEFMFEYAAEQHGLILWILVVMFFFFCKSLSYCELKISQNNDNRGRHLEFYFHTGIGNWFQCFLVYPILGDPGAVSRVDKMFVVKVFCKIETSRLVSLSTRLTAPGSPRMSLPRSQL